MKFDFYRLRNSLKHAYNGLKHSFLREQNFRIELLAAFLALGLGLYLKISLLAWLWVSFSIFFVLCTELLNTAVERLTDLATDKRKTNLAKQAKDIAAAAVLLSALQALIAGLIVFGPPLYKVITSLDFPL